MITFGLNMENHRHMRPSLSFRLGFGRMTLICLYLASEETVIQQKTSIVMRCGFDFEKMTCASLCEEKHEIDMAQQGNDSELGFGLCFCYSDDHDSEGCEILRESYFFCFGTWVEFFLEVGGFCDA